MIADQQILGALRAERDFVAKGVGFNVVSVRQAGANTVFAIEPQRGGKSRSIDESLEGSRVLWGDEAEGRGEVVYVNPDEGEIILRFCVGAVPARGGRIRLFQRDFLSPVIQLWEDDAHRTRARRLHRRDGSQTGGIAQRALPARYDQLRPRQKEAVEAGSKRTVLLLGPPGTGKTFTAGAVIARLLSRFKGSRIIVAGPTNVAVDGALIEADNWLVTIGRPDLRGRLKRVGAWFDPRKYADRQHLLAPGVYDAAARLSALELDEPPRRQVEAYVKWKDAVEAARKDLRTNLKKVLDGADVIAATTATLAQWHDTIIEKTWNFVVCDEASQIPFPTAWMIGSMGRRAYFAGDPNQLAPVVQNPSPEVAKVLGRTAFETLPRAERVELDEQSRMCPAICDAVSRTFYGGLLRVCERARKSEEWTKSRSSCFIDGREVPRVYVEQIADPGRWSPKYGGLVRLESASVVRDLTEELLGSYVSADEILVLTPFRAQRALLRKLFFRDQLRSVRISTVHRSQGTESSVVIFDPVIASTSFLNSPDGRRLINVAVSRAKAHIAIMANEDDLKNPWIKKLHSLSRSLWHRTDAYAKPFAVKRKPVMRAAG